MGRWRKRRENFRAVLAGKSCVYPASVFDPISARIARDLGYETGMFAGSVASLTVLGAPDLVVLTLSEFAQQAHRICRAADLPLLVDGDHGYGNALNVMRSIEELETAGVAAISIEDSILPRPFNASGVPKLVSIEEGVGKLRAALEARCDSRLVIAGRTSAAIVTGLDDAIKRAGAYQAAGADAVFLVGVKTRAELDAIAGEIKVPLILGGVGPEIMDLDYLGQRGVRICLQGHQTFAAAVRAVHETMKALREGMAPGKLENIADKDLMERVMRHGDYGRWMDDFL